MGTYLEVQRGGRAQAAETAASTSINRFGRFYYFVIQVTWVPQSPRHLLPVASEPKSALFGGVAGPLALLEQRPIGTAAPPGQGLAQPELKRQYD